MKLNDADSMSKAELVESGFLPRYTVAWKNCYDLPEFDGFMCREDAVGYNQIVDGLILDNLAGRVIA